MNYIDRHGSLGAAAGNKLAVYRGIVSFYSAADTILCKALCKHLKEWLCAISHTYLCRKRTVHSKSEYSLSSLFGCNISH